MMGEIMQFPETVEEFMQSYKITDTQQVYTNGPEHVITQVRIAEQKEEHWLKRLEKAKGGGTNAQATQNLP